MPIRFRCQHCSQLLGIARRRAGAAVRCPTCLNEVLVPASTAVLPGTGEDSALEPTAQAGEPPARAPGPAAGVAQGPSLFERDDFEALLRGSVSASMEAGRGRPPRGRTPVPSGRQPGPPPVPRPADPAPVPAVNVEPWPAANAPAGGLVLSPSRATVLTVVVILLLALAFAAGLLVGRFYLG
jgi:hypothetical protein